MSLVRLKLLSTYLVKVKAQVVFLHIIWSNDQIWWYLRHKITSVTQNSYYFIDCRKFYTTSSSILQKLSFKIISIPCVIDVNLIIQTN